MATDKSKVTVYLTPEANLKVDLLKKKTGMSKAKITTLAAQSGIDVIAMAFDPDWKEFFEARIKADNEAHK